MTWCDYFKFKHFSSEYLSIMVDTMKKGSQSEGVVYHAGFPNAAEDQRVGGLSLDALVVQHRASTFFWKLDESIGELGWGIGSIVVVDRALSPREGDKVVVVLDEEFKIRVFHKVGSISTLLQLDGTPETGTEHVLWGVITYVVQGVRH